jgi:hypothetical protein
LPGKHPPLIAMSVAFRWEVNHRGNWRAYQRKMEPPRRSPSRPLRRLRRRFRHAVLLTLGGGERSSWLSIKCVSRWRTVSLRIPQAGEDGSRSARRRHLGLIQGLGLEGGRRSSLALYKRPPVHSWLPLNILYPFAPDILDPARCPREERVGLPREDNVVHGMPRIAAKQGCHHLHHLRRQRATARRERRACAHCKPIRGACFPFCVDTRLCERDLHGCSRRIA